MTRLLAVFLIMAAAFVFGGTAFAQSNMERAEAFSKGLGPVAKLSPDEQIEFVRRQRQMPVLLVAKDQYGNGVGMLPPVSSLPSVSLPAMPAIPVDAVRPPRPAAPQAPLAAKRPQAPPAPVSPQAPKPPTETAAKASAPPKDYPRGEVVSDQAKKLYLRGQLVGEIRARRGRLRGELVNVDQNALHIDIRPGNYLSRIAIPVDRGLYKIAFATGKGWVFLPEKTNKIPAGCKSVQIGD